MTTRMWAVTLMALMTLSAPRSWAQERERQPVPTASLVAAMGNFLFMPPRLAVTAIGAELGGITGLMTAGNTEAAEDVWGLFSGQAILTPSIVQGEEPLEFGVYEYKLLLVTPGR